MSEETNPAGAIQSILAWLSPISGRVKPTLEDTMSKLARVALFAPTFAIIGAGRSRIVVLSRVTSFGLLPRMGVRALGPVM